MNQGLLTFVTILGVMERLCNFRLVLERKTGKEIPESSRLEFLEKVLANNFALSDAEDNNSSLLNRGGIYSRFTFVENTISNSPKVLRAKFLGVMDSFVLITSLSELYFRFRFILLVQMKKKKRFLWSMAAAQAAENHGDECGSTCYLWWVVYTSIPTWTHSQNSQNSAVEAWSLKILSHGTSLKWSRRPC